MKNWSEIKLKGLQVKDYLKAHGKEVILGASTCLGVVGGIIIGGKIESEKNRKKDNNRVYYSPSNNAADIYLFDGYGWSFITEYKSVADTVKYQVNKDKIPVTYRHFQKKK